MAIGLTDHVWRYRKHIGLLGHLAPALTKQMDERIVRLLAPALQDQPRRRTPAPSPVETLEEHEKEAAPLQKAA
jgi:hypothetical protein